ncbi:MAG: cation:proton antiporter, partial [Rhodothermales bacterium]|nr:cation:proton antiporter [Rhodothermales bacterium]
MPVPLAAAAPPFLVEAAVLLVAGAAVAYVGYRLGLVPIVGFLLTGVIIGPYGLGLIEDREMVDALAEVGVILLLFTIGIEFSLEKLARIQRLIFGGGGLQVGLTAGIVTGVLLLFGVPWQAGLFTGFLVALSSTAIVLKLLGSRGETDTEPGQVSLGLLIFQDLAIIVMVLLVPMLAGAGGSAGEIAWALVKAALVIAAVLLVARRVMPIVLERVARTCSQELFLLAVIAICFGLAWLTSLAGVSVALGAFLAGLVVSESRFSEHAFGEIMPLQILFSATFFVSVGMLLDLGFLAENVGLVLAVVAAVLVIKVLATGVSARALGYSLPVSTASALVLAQVGEFSFVLERAGRELGLTPAGLGEAGSQAFIAATVLLMVATPFLASLGSRIGRQMAEREQGQREAVMEAAAEGLAAEHHGIENHVVVAGYGRAARRLVRVLRGSGIPHVVVTLSPPRADEAESEGLPVVRGHPARAHALEEARIGKAKLLLLADDDPALAHRVVAVARGLNPTMRIVARARYRSDAEELEAAGADRVIAQEFEIVVQLFADVLRDYGVAPEEIGRHEETMRRGGYVALREGQPDGRAPVVCRVDADHLDARRVRVRPDSEAAGVALGALDLGRHGIYVDRVHRDGAVVEDPAAAFVLRPDDELELMGAPDAFLAVAPLFRAAGLGLDGQGADVPRPAEPSGDGAPDAATVTVYGAEWCALTSGFRTYLDRRRIPFAFRDVEKEPEAEEAVRAMNG